MKSPKTSQNDPKLPTKYQYDSMRLFMVLRDVAWCYSTSQALVSRANNTMAKSHKKKILGPLQTADRIQKRTQPKNVECIVSMFHKNEGIRCSSVFAFAALQVAIDIMLWRQVFDKIWHQNPMSESRRENLFLVLTRHQSELQKYIWWLVFS